MLRERLLHYVQCPLVYIPLVYSLHRSTVLRYIHAYKQAAFKEPLAWTSKPVL